jgi:hypothetical protein
MDSEKSTSEARLVDAFARLGLVDPRESYRSVLRELRARDADAFSRATTHYQRQVLPALVSVEDPVAAWIDYGRIIGEMTAPGRMMSVDSTGRAFPFSSPVRGGELVVFVPDDGTRGAFAAAVPSDLSPAQKATLSLLVDARLALQD